jgi:eukaryotic-like serine/threonine-protein kinase
MAASRPLLDDDGQPSSGSPLRVGDVVNGKYRIERQIGRGGMGIVLAATHLQLENVVAIKVMRRDLVADERALNRLLMEARAAARIRSEHVARVLDVGTLDNGSPFIVMEYLEGENLADLLDRQGALDVEHAAAFLLQCCLALAEVHVAEMVHRDLKPGNIFIARLPDGAPSVKIVDFGISKNIGAAHEHAATTSPQVLGSPYYMAPEQMRAESVDERSDIWGLGAILFEMLTGRPPFLGDTLPEVYSAVLNHPPPSVESLRPGVPSGLGDVVLRCLEKDPAQRFRDVADLAEALAPYAGPAAQLVERVTRILTNPDAQRVRHSLAPGPAMAGNEQGTLQSSSGRGAAAFQANLGEPGFASAQGGMMGDFERGDRGGSRPPGAEPLGHVDPARPGGTLLEGGSDSQRSLHHRASRPPGAGGEVSSDLTALSATGVHHGRSHRRGIAKGWWWAAAAAVLGVSAVFWPRNTPSERAPATARELEPAAAQRPIETAPTEPRVTPLVESERAAPPAADGVQIEAESHALRPLPRAKPTPPVPTPTPAAVPPHPASSASSGSVSPAGAAPSSSRVSPPASSVESQASGADRPPARPAHVDDPWNPASFGDRR